MSAKDPLNQTLPASSSGPRYGLVYGRRTLPLSEGEFILGRGEDCHITLDSAQVSRRHARLLVTMAGVVVEDLGSVNGVILDGQRVAKRATVAPGATLKLADELLRLVDLTHESARTTAPLRHSDTLRVDLAETAGLENTERRQDAFAMLSTVAEKSLALGRVADAERVLSGVLGQVLADAQAKKPLPAALTEGAARQAARLAVAAGHGRWANYAISLYAALRRPLPMDVIDSLHENVRKLPQLETTRLSQYVTSLAGVDLSPAERFALRRLEGLLRVLKSI